MTMDFQSAMETFAEAWVAANSKPSPLAELAATQSQALALTRNSKSPPQQTTPTANAGGGGAGGGGGGGSSRDSDHRRTPTPLETTTAATDLRAGTPMDAAASPPSSKDDFDNAGKPLAKSLPVHCVVEAVCTLDESRQHHHHHHHHHAWRRRGAATLVETDSFVIIPAATPFHELVHAALAQLGYSPESVAAARGSVVIKNWKALAFEQIADDALASVGEILGELTSVATLRIQVFRGRPGAMTDIKDKLLRFLMVQSHQLLVSTGCPLDEVLLSQICRGGAGHTPPELTDDGRKKFDQWWSAQFSPQSPGRPHLGPPCAYPPPPAAVVVAPHTAKLLERAHSADATSAGGGAGHPAMQTVHNQFPTQKTRMRTSFDPELELPKLQRWFADNPHPTRQQIQQYVKELNGLQSRRGRKPLDVNNVVYWFKNARAAQKRAEIRSVGPGGLAACHLVNGYSSYSPTNGGGGGGFLVNDGYLKSERLDYRLKPNNHHCRSAGLGVGGGAGANTSRMSDEYSNTGSDMDDDDVMHEPPGSPVGPLSLTTTPRKMESRDASPRPTSGDHIEIVVKDEPKHHQDDQPINYHSASDHSNNNKVLHSISDGDGEGDGDGDGDGDESEVETAPPTPTSKHSNHFDMVSHMMRPISSSSPDGILEHQHRAPPPPPGGDGLERLAASFPLVPNSMFSHSIMYMSQYIPGLSQHAAAAAAAAASTSPPGALAALTADERRKRNRTFIDPVTEVPRLEQWFSLNTHPSHNLILKYTEELNCMAYRQKFPRLEPKNVQFWFKNRRAKCKRLKMSLFEAPPGISAAAGHYAHADKE